MLSHYKGFDRSPWLPSMWRLIVSRSHLCLLVYFTDVDGFEVFLLMLYSFAVYVMAQLPAYLFAAVSRHVRVFAMKVTPPHMVKSCSVCKEGVDRISIQDWPRNDYWARQKHSRSLSADSTVDPSHNFCRNRTSIIPDLSSHVCSTSHRNQVSSISLLIHLNIDASVGSFKAHDYMFCSVRKVRACRELGHV